MTDVIIPGLGATEPTLDARVWFIDVGAGDCTLVMDVATRRAVLVDCPTWHVQNVQSLLLQQEATLDTVIVTHWDLDHYGGASRLAVKLPVRRILYNHDTLFPSNSSPQSYIPSALKNFLNVPDSNEVLGPAAVGQHGGFGSVEWQILAPTHAEITKAYVTAKRNIASAIVDIKVDGLRILVGGDAVGDTWQRLLLEKAELKADILRWPHHGADLANDTDGTIRDSVLTAVRPTYVVISTGAKNNYGHPSVAVVRESSSRSAVLCTQVTAGCFGYASRADRRSDEARSIVDGLPTPYCAGTVYVECRAGSYTIVPSLADHSSRVDKWPLPLCRPPT